MDLKMQELEMPLAVKEKLGMVKLEKVQCCVQICKEFRDILAENAISLSMAVNIGLEMFLRSKGLYPR